MSKFNQSTCILEQHGFKLLIFKYESLDLCFSLFFNVNDVFYTHFIYMDIQQVLDKLQNKNTFSQGVCHTYITCYLHESLKNIFLYLSFN